VDRSAAYAARYVAKNVVAAGLAERFEVQLAYAIGVAKPVSIMTESFGTNKVDEEIIRDLIASTSTCAQRRSSRSLTCVVDLQADSGVRALCRNDIDAPWEATDKADILRKGAGEGAVSAR